MREPVFNLSLHPWHWGFRRIVAIFVFAALVVGAVGVARAQDASSDSLQNLSPDQLRQMLGGQNSADTSEAGSAIGPRYTILEPTAPSNPVLPQSRLEKILSARIGVELSQFGYDQLGVGRPIDLPEIGAVQDDYVLGPGDEIVVTLRGQDNSEHHITVDRDGNVVLPRISPIAAAGRTFGDFRAQLLASIHNAYVATEAYVTVGRLRQISVMVAGEVGSPGVRILTGLSTPIDAILVSGGIKKSGSLRDVQIVHQGRTTMIDLYAYLTSGVVPRQIALSDGDRIVVPPLGKVIAAAGWVRRPGIYELPPGLSGMRVETLTALAGGLEVRGRYRLGIMRIRDDGRTELAAVPSQSSIVRDGDILLALPSADQVVDRATLSGGTTLAGSYAIKSQTHLSDLLKAPGALGPSPYTIFGIISRRDPRTFLRSLIAFSPISALTGDNDPVVASDDIVRIFSMNESRLLSKSVTDFAAKKETDEEAVRNPASPETTNTTSSTASVQQAIGSADAISGPDQSAAPGPVRSSDRTQQFAARLTPQNVESNPQLAALVDQNRSSASREIPPSPANYEQDVPAPGFAPLNSEVTTIGQLAAQLGVDTDVLLNFLSDHEVTLEGAVRGPGSYVVGPNINLHDLVMVAGGTVRWADESGVELITTNVDQRNGNATTIRKTLALSESTLANYTIKPHDELRFRQVFTNTDLGHVTLEGEVRFPGQYKILRGEHLLDLLKRAGGLTDVAYPYGTVFLRHSIAALEHESFQRLADGIENQLLAAMSRSSATAKLDPSSFAAAQGFIATLREQKGLGRVSITADPTILAAHPSENPLLESGDVIYIPQRPSTVSVLGEVLQPGSYTYRQSMTPDDYLGKAGGYTAFADSSLTYVILPDGSAEKLEKSWLPFDSRNLPPGSVIVVPRDIAPFLWSDFAVNASQIFSQLAVAGASLAVISTNLK